MPGFDHIPEKERLEILKKIMENEKKQKEKSQQQLRENILSSYPIEKSARHQEFLEERKRILKRFHFSPEDCEIVEILQKMDNPNRDYLSFFYVMTVFDYHYYVEHIISFDYVIQDKFYYLFGANFLLEVENNSKKSVLYQVAKKIYELMEKNKDHYPKIETLNHYLSIIGALGIVVSYEPMLLNHHFTIAFHSSRLNTTFCFLIPPSASDNPLFKDLYEFYFEYAIKPNDIALLQKKAKNLTDSFLSEAKEEYTLFAKKNNKKSEWERMIDNKLENLRKKGGGIY